MISRDKLKIQTFCKIVDLGNQLDQADQVHDIKKVEEVSRKLDQMERKLPEYTEMVGAWETLIRIRKTRNWIDNLKVKRVL